MCLLFAKLYYSLSLNNIIEIRHTLTFKYNMPLFNLFCARSCPTKNMSVCSGCDWLEADSLLQMLMSCSWMTNFKENQVAFLKVLSKPYTCYLSGMQSVFSSFLILKKMRLCAHISSQTISYKEFPHVKVLQNDDSKTASNCNKSVSLSHEYWIAITA